MIYSIQQNLTEKNMFGWIKKKRQELALIENEIEKAKKQLENKKSEIRFEEKKIEDLKNYESGLRVYIDLGQSYIPTDNEDALEIKRANIQDRIINSLKDGAYKLDTTCELNDSKSLGKKIQKTCGDGLVGSLNAYIDSKEKSITLDNYQKAKRLIENKFNDYQKKSRLIGVSLNKEYVKNRIDMLKIKAEIKQAKKFRLQEERKERERIREENKLLEEAENERKRLKLEREAMDLAYAKALSDEEREEIKNNLVKIDMRLADIDYRISNKRAGYLYIIDTPSLPDMTKIGVTRRLNPAIRIKELSSSSLPFPFQLRAFCFCDDVFFLESQMHEYFDSHRVSPQREFFYVSTHDAIEALKNKFHKEVQYGIIENEGELE